MDRLVWIRALGLCSRALEAGVLCNGNLQHDDVQKGGNHEKERVFLITRVIGGYAYVDAEVTKAPAPACPSEPPGQRATPQFQPARRL
ncbi:hypothetical protein [Stutzerimonas nosocomialis]|uniref:hypothetical protein n=1 Tax=Stutzerimonas nosocomialis TaxID=1056496 RepID=UPI0039C97E63